MSEKRPTILIVDDEPHIIRALTFVLEREGYELTTAMDGAEALAAAGTVQPDLAIVDAMMPKMDGFALCQHLRRDPQLAGTQILFLTAKGQEADRQRAVAAGADQYLTKPFSPSEVVTVVRSLLNTRR